MPSRARSSAGRWPTTCAQSSSSTRSGWRLRAGARAWARPPLRPGKPIRVACLRPKGTRRRHRCLDGLARRCLRQCGRRVVLRNAEEGARQPPFLADRRDLVSAVFEYIEVFYNRERRHSTLDYLSPTDYEKISLLLKSERGGIQAMTCRRKRGHSNYGRWLGFDGCLSWWLPSQKNRLGRNGVREGFEVSRGARALRDRAHAMAELVPLTRDAYGQLGFMAHFSGL